ncbi:MAG TPA: glucoamylase family protein, partial [Candidatus Eisenbacteria bacterium]
MSTATITPTTTDIIETATAPQRHRDILSPEGLEAHARLLAGRFAVGESTGEAGHVFHERLNAGARILRDAYRKLIADAAGAESPLPAAEWLLDNFHLVEAELADIRRNMPKRFIDRLPVLTGGDHAGRPRIQALAIELLRHSDASIDLARLIRYITAFQTLVPLTIGELWAWPTLLKAELIENIRRLAEQLMVSRDARLTADRFIHRFEAAGEDEPMPPLPDPLPAASVAQLLERFREFGPRVSPLRVQLSERLAARGLSPEEAIRAEHVAQAAAQTSMANAITGLRLCSTLDWNRNFERVSLVEQALRRDPSGVYARMDFASRNRYREAIEALAGPTGESEIGVALKAVELARRGAQSAPHDVRVGHVGHYILGGGRPQLEAASEHPARGIRSLRRAVFSAAAPLYIGSILLLTGFLVWLALRLIPGGGFDPLITGLLILPASDLAIHIVQWLVPLVARPHRLPRLDLESGVPEEGRTMVIVPTLLTSVEGVRHLLDNLEVQALANDDPRIHFALVTDFADAPSGEMPDDPVILEAARAGIRELNARHGPARTDQFHLLHRGRRWNPIEKVWMGWERKRGKIEEFNRYIRGDSTTGFEVHVGDPTVLSKVRYCITLDSDTRLPRGVARQLIGIALHPLHRPVFDPKSGRVASGYGILQPRVSVTMSSVAGSLFSRVYAGHTGVDPYTTAVSDVYQDLFCEGIFTGKGLYDVDALMSALEGRVPPNLILSHDLFEGLHARTGLVSDLEVVDDYPSSVLVHTRRQHRWVRGDWQILLWLLPWVPKLGGLAENRLPLISRWKIFDNLRRSLVAPSLLVLLAFAWTVLPGSPLSWTLGVLLAMAFPVYRPIAQALHGPGPGQSWRHFTREIGHELSTALAQTLMAITFLAYHAYRMTHAVILTLARLLITRQRLLEWETAAFVSRLLEGRGLTLYLAEMGMSPIMALFLTSIIIPLRPHALPVAAPFLLLWTLAPLLAWRWSRPTRIKEFDPSPEERAWLERIAARTWDYFKQYMTADNHWLPPDNLQEIPTEMLARRTSPTNIGLGLLSTLAAHDLGFLDEAGLVERLEGAMDTIEGLEQHEGHLLNWYSTATLAPLHPRYVSTVDSGNLAGALVALAVGLREVAADSTRDAPGDGSTGVARRRRLLDLAERCEARMQLMDFRFLFDRERKLFTIGYRLADREGPGRPDTGYYDLLASEARLASFIAIAKGDVPEEHWFHLGRLLVDADGRPTLVSWSASMFEYLMPMLLLRNYPGTLLDAACRGAVAHQVAFASRHGIPWGISESGYPLMDRAGHYQYKAFGVPGIGLKRGLGEELVVAPYATFLAAQVDLEESLRNLKKLARAGLEGPFGFYEAIDCTRDPGDGRGDVAGRPRKAGDTGVIVRSFLAHHQGMTLLALANVLRKGIFQRRFHCDPRMQATELLLQERLPRRVSIGPMRPAEESRATPVLTGGAVRRYRSPHTPAPHTHFLSNGTYTAFVTNAGGGASLCRGRAVTRWREDMTRDHGSQFLYLRDARSGRAWSAAWMPLGGEPDDYLVTFELEKATLQRTEDDIETRLDITVSPEEDMEVRRLSITNRGSRPRDIEVTSYVEFALAEPAADLAHPAFHRLFLESSWVPDSHAVLVARRPREAGEAAPCGVHVVSVDGRLAEPVEY